MDSRTVTRMKWISALGAILLFAILLAIRAEASEQWDVTSPFSLTDISLGYRSYFPGGRDRLLSQNGLPNRNPGQELGLQTNIDLLTYGYLDFLVHGGTDRDTVEGGGQFRDVGLQLRLGVRLFDWLELGYYHHSQHMIDREDTLGFPVLDGWELNIHVFKRRGERQSLF